MATFIVVLMSLLISAIGTFGPFGVINGDTFGIVEIIRDVEETGYKGDARDPRLYAQPIGEFWFGLGNVASCFRLVQQSASVKQSQTGEKFTDG